MEPFLCRLSFLMAILVFVGCGRGRVHPPPGKPYAVTMAEGIVIAPAASAGPRPAVRGTPSRGRSGGVNVGSGLGTWNCGSGKDALVGLAALVAVILVVAVVVTVVDSTTATSTTLVDRYHLTLSGEEVPLAIVVITDTNHLYLQEHEHDALVRGAYTRAVLRPAVWEGTRGAPTQEVAVTIVRGGVNIAPVAPPVP